MASSLENATPARQLAGFVAKYTPEVATLARRVLAKMRAQLPEALALVYDNYNALAIAFGPTESPRDAIFSIALYPRWVSLFFVHGAELPDPHRLLKGSGKGIRHIVLDDAAMLDSPPICALMRQAVARAPKPLDRNARGRIIIKSISAKQRPRRPNQSRQSPPSRQER